ncbi:hypothetical protein ACP70R_024278 [Stipagrostis hirtigluma subsp. patula]
MVNHLSGFINQEPRKSTPYSRGTEVFQMHMSWQFHNMEEFASNVSSVEQYWKQRKYRSKDIWLEACLRREIQALTRDENVEAIIYQIYGVIESLMERCETKTRQG